MRRRLAALLLAGRSLSVAAVEPELEAERFDLRHYEVAGRTAEALRAGIDAKGPRGERGELFAGRTDWEVRYRYWTRRDSTGCRIDRLQISHATTMTLPRWTDEAAADAALRQRWQSFTQALREHEEGHRRHGQLAAAALAGALAALPSRRECTEFQAVTQALADEIIGRHAAMGPAYDRETDHGRARGARFP